MENMEDNSPDWVEARRLYETTRLSLRKIGEASGTNHTSVRNRARSEQWKRFREGARPNLESFPVESRTESDARALADADPRTLQEHGRLIIQRMMSEMEASMLRADELEDLIEQEFAGRPNARRRATLMKLLSLESRAKVANHLATALARLTDAQPGKKAQAQIDAENAGRGKDSEWGDDLAGPSLFN